MTLVGLHCPDAFGRAGTISTIPRVTVEDIGSLNGTYVNRQPRLLPGNPVELKSGDEIIIGKTFLKLVVDPVS